MATHILFFSFTQQGIEGISESPTRVENAKKIVQSLGGSVKDFYAVMGCAAFDTIFIIDAPDDAIAAKAALAIAQKGNVRTNTVRAFTEDEFQQLVSGLA